MNQSNSLTAWPDLLLADRGTVNHKSEGRFKTKQEKACLQVEHPPPNRV
ncbi:MAG: hypothetical protein MK312_09965 [Roseibacillus sp.]|nr:hypothetical protein [Roseibacillus sp.]